MFRYKSKFNLKHHLEVQRLHADVATQRAAAGVSSNLLKQSILEVERHFEKIKRLDCHIISLTERVEKERYLNKGLLIAIEDSTIKAESAFEGIENAATNQVDLINRYHKLR